MGTFDHNNNQKPPFDSPREERQSLNNSGQNGSTWWYKKIDLPLFTEDNPDNWISKAMRYCTFYNLDEAEKVDAAVVRLDG